MNNYAKMALEVLDNLDVQRLQGNISREFDKQNNSGTISGCINGDKVVIADLTWRVSHSLGREAIGFVIIAQGTTSSIICSMSNMTLNDSEIKFSADPVSFTLFFY